MKKALRKLFALSLAAALTLSLSACGQTNTGSAGSGGNTSTPTQSSNTSASGFPDSTITILVGFSAGSGTDLGARLLANSLSEVLGVPVVVENTPGSGSWMVWNQLIKNTEAGVRPLPVERLEILADFYETSTDYLLGRTAIKKPYPKN